MREHPATERPSRSSHDGHEVIDKRLSAFGSHPKEQHQQHDKGAHARRPIGPHIAEEDPLEEHDKGQGDGSGDDVDPTDDIHVHLPISSGIGCDVSGTPPTALPTRRSPAAVARMSRTALSFLVVLMLPLLLKAPAVGSRTDPGPPIQVVTPDARFVLLDVEPGAVGTAHTAYTRARSGLVEGVGWPVDFTPTVVLVGDRNRFLKMAGGLPVSGYAVPSETAMVIDYPAAVAGNTLVRLLRHELCHLLLHRRIPKSHLPRWLDEGICQWASDGLSDLVYGTDQKMLQGAVLSDRHLSLRDLNTGFRGDARTLQLAYAQSSSLVRYLDDTFGADGVRRLLNALGAGMPLERAVPSALGISLSEWEAAWRGSFDTVWSRLAALAYHLYGLLFFLMALLTLVAYGRYRLRKKRMAIDEEADLNDPQGPSASGPPPS